MTFLLHFVIVSSFMLGSASNECPGGDRSSVVVVPSSGPTVCLPIDDYIQLQQQEAQAVSDGETVSYVHRLTSPTDMQHTCNCIMHVGGRLSHIGPGKLNILVVEPTVYVYVYQNIIERFKFRAITLPLHVASLAQYSREIY